MEEDEGLYLDSEDLQSAFNLFAMPDCWLPYLAYSKKFDSAAFGLPPGTLMRPALSVVPMGWHSAVALVQEAVRNVVFEKARIPRQYSIEKRRRLPEEKIFTIVYLDNFDEIHVVKSLDLELQQEGGELSPHHSQFIAACDEAGLPRNLGKQLIHAFAGGLQGGELDGTRGVLKLAADKLRCYIELSLALLSRTRWSEFYLRHWTGKTAFLATFKRSMFSGIANIFTAIELSRKGPINPTPEVIDEIMCLMIQAPLAEVNLKAVISPEISCTDASPTGGGSAIATTFKDGPEPHGPLAFFDGRCQSCGHDFSANIPTKSEGRKQYPCSVSCGAILCSVRCSIQHRKAGCARDMFACPLFGERFSGPNYPLTKAVALAGIGVQPPLDILVDDDPWDFSTAEGKQRWDEYEVEPGLLSEHFAPECKTFSAARGRPAITTTGRWIAGPRALRSDLKPWGLDHLSPQEQVKVRRGNSMAKRSLRGLKAAFDGDRFGVLEHPYSSHLWSTPEAIELAEREDVYHTYFSACCFGGARTKWTSLLHNVAELHDELHKPTCPGHADLLPYEIHDEEGGLRFDTEAEAEYTWGLCTAYACGLKRAMQRRTSVPFGLCPWDGRAAILAALQRSTRGLQRNEVAESATTEVMRVLRTMRPGSTSGPCFERFAFVGPEVRFEAVPEDGSTTILAPYPAFRWQWKTKLSYPWKHPQHINVLEVSAFLVEFRRRVRDLAALGTRFFNITDSQVGFFTMSKGWSKAPRLNRLLRRINAVILMSQAMPIHLWTISKWNFADAPSRRFE